MKEFSDSLPAFEPEHLWLLLLNMFNYLRKYICVEEVFIQRSKSNKFKNRKTYFESRVVQYFMILQRLYPIWNKKIYKLSSDDSPQF